jgi:hypothetical protein
LKEAIISQGDPEPVKALERRGHEAVGISRTQGVDVHTGEGLVTALTGADAVVDASNSAATEHDEAVAFFSRSTRNLLEAERQTGVQQHRPGNAVS